MKKLYACYGIDFEKPFDFKPWEHVLTENSFRKEYGDKELVFLIFTRVNEDWHDLNVVPVFNGKFSPKYSPRSGCHPHFISVGDFDAARKTIGKEQPKDMTWRGERRKSWWKCYVLVPSEFRIIKDENRHENKIDTLIEQGLLRIKDWQEVHSIKNTFCYCNRIKLERYKVSDSFHVYFVPDKSGYKPRTAGLEARARQIRLNRSKEQANRTDWSIKVYAAEEGIAALKRKSIEMLYMVDSEFDWQQRNEYLDLCRDMFSAATKLNELKKSIANKSLSCMENTESSFKFIMKTVREHLQTEIEEVVENV